MSKNSQGFVAILIILGLAVISSTGVLFYNTAKGNPPKFLTNLFPASNTEYVEHTPELTSSPEAFLTPSPPPCSRCNNTQKTIAPTTKPSASTSKTPTPNPSSQTNSSINEYKETIINYESYEDVNGNYIKDTGEGNISSVFELKINESENWKTVKTETTGSSGKKSFTILQPGSYQLEPAGMTFYRQPGPQYFSIDKNGGTKSFSFGYYPQTSTTGFKIYVFNDKNENGTRDSDEENMHYQYAKITNLQGISVGTLGTSWNVAVPETGAEETYIPYGEYKVELIPESDSWTYYYKITKQSDIAFLGTGEGQKTISLGAHKLY